MKIEFNNIRKLENLLMERYNLWFDEVEGYSSCDEFWEIHDKKEWEDTMGNVEITPENIIKYYEKCPDVLDIIKDDIDADYELQHWNVNAWRNS